MLPNPSRLGALTLGLSIFALAPQASAQGITCWDSNLGTNLSLGDDAFAVGLSLNFMFDMPGGGQTNLIDVCSNGFVGLVSGAITNTALTPTVNTLLSEAERIAPFWTDLTPNTGGGVYFYSGPSSANITWLDVPEYGVGGSNTVQLKLMQGGAFVLSYRSVNTPGSRDLLIGCSPGGNVVDPGEVDFSTAPISSAGNPTVYELFTAATDVRDIAGSAFLFQPDGAGGYLVIPIGPCALATPYGDGCPAQPVFYELFDASNPLDLSNTALLLQADGLGGFTVMRTNATIDPNFSNNLMLGDDALSLANPLGFTVNLPGFGAVSTVDIDSNGRVGFGLPSSDYTESVVEMLVQPLIPVLWDDLNPTTGGGVYFDTPPGKAMVTWDQVPEYTATGANTAQIQFFPNGDILLVYGACSLLDALVGYSPAGTPDPGPIDLSAAAPFTLSGGAMQHDNVGGAAPLLGTTVNLELTNVSVAAVLAAVNIGVTPLALDLTPIGMPGCTLLTSVEISLPVALAGQSGSVPLPLPNNVAFAGIVLHTQGLALVPGINPLGAVASNAIRQQLGN